MPRDRMDGQSGSQDNGEQAHFEVDVPSRAVDSRTLIKDSHAYQRIPKDQSSGIPLKFEDWFARREFE